ncbi:MAG: hypothetical protein V1870_04620 [Candidatus Aenigmatarchaeota archaeon]
MISDSVMYIGFNMVDGERVLVGSLTKQQAGYRKAEGLVEDYLIAMTPDGFNALVGANARTLAKEIMDKYMNRFPAYLNEELGEKSKDGT